ncbi:TPA: hypothetical protein ACHK07_005545, partial [Escherichia coli]
LYPCYTELNKIRAMQLNNAYISDFQNPDEISSK